VSNAVTQCAPLDLVKKSPKTVSAHCCRCGEICSFVRVGFENKVNGQAVYNCQACTATVTYSRLQADADAAKHEQLIDLAGERIAVLSAALTKIRDLAKAGRLDEIFTLANRALGDCK